MQCIEIYGIADTTNEPTENLIIQIPNLNLCIVDTVVDTIKIFNHNPMEVSITGDTIVCEGQTGQLIAQTSQHSLIGVQVAKWVVLIYILQKS